MTSPLRLAVLPVLTLCFAVGACTAFEPLADQSTTPDWVRERLVTDLQARKAPQSVPDYGLTARDAAQLDADADQVLRRRARQAAEFARIAAEGRVEVDDFVTDGRTRTTPPQ